MEAKTKKMIFFIGAIFVGIIFLTSYAAFGNNGSATTVTSTVAAVSGPTVFAVGNANALITGYSQVAYVSPLNDSNSTAGALAGLMAKLEANGSIDNYVNNNNNSYEVYSSELSAYALQEALDAKLNSNNAVIVGSTADIMLPGNLSMYYPNASRPISVPLPDRNYTIYLSSVRSVGSPINVSVSALLTERGTLYNNQLRISLG